MKNKKLTTLIILSMISLTNLFGQKLIDVDYDYVFDKAEYHTETMVEEGLSEDQAYVHIGLFFAWLINNDLTDKDFNDENSEEIKSHKKREISPCQIFKNWDGVLIGEQLNKLGYNFAINYYDKKYLDDYQKGLKISDDDLFKVEDSWENYDQLKKTLDKAFKKWK